MVLSSLRPIQLRTLIFVIILSESACFVMLIWQYYLKRNLHANRTLREEKVDPKKVKTQEMLAYEAQQRGEITTARKGTYVP